MAPPKTKPKRSAKAAASKANATKQLQGIGKFKELTTREIPFKSSLAKKLFDRVLSTGRLPKLKGATYRAARAEFVKVLTDTRHTPRQFGFSTVDELLLQMREWMNAGQAADVSSLPRFVAQRMGKESVALGKLTERFVKAEKTLQEFLKTGADSHRSLVNAEIAAKSGNLIYGNGNPVPLNPPIAPFGPPRRIRNVKRTIVNREGKSQEVEFFDHGYVSQSPEGLRTFGSAQEIKTPGVAQDISAQVALRDPRVEGSISLRFEEEISPDKWRQGTAKPEELVSLPGSLVAVGITVQNAEDKVKPITPADMTKVLAQQSSYRIVGRVQAQRLQVVIGVPITNLRALLRAATRK